MKKFPQDVHYVITEWDGTLSVVKARHVGRGARTYGYRTDGKPYLRAGGDVLMQYQDGVVHRVSARYFESLNPSVACYAPPGPNW